MALTRAEIADRLIIKLGMPKTTAQEFVDAFFEEIATTLESGDIVKLTGFGNFELKVKSARPGRNPKTGETLTIPARKKVKFKVSKIFNENVLGEQEQTQG